MNILSIDTTDSKTTKLSLQKGKETYELVEEYDKPQADKILLEIESLLKNNNTKPQELNKIIVQRTAGSYTGIRVGLTIANTLAFALRIPVNDKKVGEYETALYT